MSQSRDIMTRDRARRQARERDELIALAAIAYPAYQDEAIPRGTMAVRADARAMGAVTSLRTLASQSSWEDGRGHIRGATIGVSTDTDLDSAAILARLERDGGATVTVIRDGITTHGVPVASFRAETEREYRRQSRARETGQPLVPETARIGVTHILTEDI